MWSPGRRIKTICKYLAVVSVGAGSLTVLSQSEWRASSLGFVRFGRAAVAVGLVVADYKLSLRGIDVDSEDYRIMKSKVHLRSAEQLRAMCWRNGGCFIKVGQHIGALEYLMPREYVDTMKVLHKHAPETPLADLQKVVKEDFGHSVEELFSYFDAKPIASASLAQVHRATRLSDGTVVAVKVQHPRVKAHSFVDMATMELLVKIVASIFPEFNFGWLAEETRKNLPLELDFVHEAHNCENVAKRFGHLRFLKVPTVDWSLTSERVLTMEFCDGGFITDSKYMHDHKISIDKVISQLGELYSEMIFVQGYIHCDPHPGNLLVKKTRGGIQIVLLDHGLYQTLSDDVRLNYCHLWQSILHTNQNDMQTYSALLGVQRIYPLFACIVTGRSWDSISHGIDRNVRTNSETHLIQSTATNFIPEITSILNSIPRELLLVFKTNDLLRGIQSALRSGADQSHHNYHARTAFLTMSRCCVEAVSCQQVKDCAGRRLCRWHYKTQKYWLLFKLSVHEIWLRIDQWIASWVPGYRKLHERVAITRLRDVLQKIN